MPIEDGVQGPGAEGGENGLEQGGGCGSLCAERQTLGSSAVMLGTHRPHPGTGTARSESRSHNGQDCLPVAAGSRVRRTSRTAWGSLPACSRPVDPRRPCLARLGTHSGGVSLWPLLHSSAIPVPNPSSAITNRETWGRVFGGWGLDYCGDCGERTGPRLLHCEWRIPGSRTDTQLGGAWLQGWPPPCAQEGLLPPH